MRKRSSSSKEDSNDNSSLIIIILILFCCCCISSIIASGIASYVLVFKQTRKRGDDPSILEYIDSKGKAHTISSLPFDVKDAYYLNLPIATKRYRFTGKKCLDKVCDDVILKNVEAINLFYDDDDGNLLSGKLEYV